MKRPVPPRRLAAAGVTSRLARPPCARTAHAAAADAAAITDPPAPARRQECRPRRRLEGPSATTPGSTIAPPPGAPAAPRLTWRPGRHPVPTLSF